MRAVRHLGRLLADLGWYGVRTGRWWLPIVTLVLAVAATLVALIKVASPTLVYVFF